jgi:hypothetical protein
MVITADGPAQILSPSFQVSLEKPVTRHPTSSWVIQQLREAFPYESAPRFLIFRTGREVWLRGSGSSAVDDHPIRFEPRFAILGRMEQRNGGSKVVAAICWTTSSLSTSAT